MNKSKEKINNSDFLTNSLENSISNHPKDDSINNVRTLTSKINHLNINGVNNQNNIKNNAINHHNQINHNQNQIILEQKDSNIVGNISLQRNNTILEEEENEEDKDYLDYLVEEEQIIIKKVNEEKEKSRLIGEEIQVS